MPSSSRDLCSPTMKGILVAGIIAALAVAAVETLSCMQCDSLADSCVNSSSTECPPGSVSCTSFLTSFSLDGAITSYQYKDCSAKNCSEERDVAQAFTVHVSDREHFYFASQCCQGKECNISDTPAPPVEDVSSSIECPACYGSNETLCHEKPRKCYKEERCVNLVAEFKNETKKLVLKGCSSISNSTCQFLSVENQTVGEVIFREFECLNGSSELIPTKTTLTTTHNTGTKVSFTSAVLASFLFLVLLF